MPESPPYRVVLPPHSRALLCFAELPSPHKRQMRAGQDNVSRLKFRGGEGYELVALSAAPQGLAQSLLAYSLLGGE